MQKWLSLLTLGAIFSGILGYSFYSPPAPVYYQLNCVILDEGFEVVWSHNRAHKICYFHDDGRYVLGGDKDLMILSPQHSLIKRIKVGVHHQFRFDGQSYYFLSSQRLPLSSNSNLSERVDTLVFMTTDGDIEKVINLTQLLEEHLGGLPLALNLTGDYFEKTHFNTIFQIKENSLSDKMPAFQAGNFLLNDNRNHMILVVSPDFDKVLWTYMFLEDGVHDVQVLESGNLLYFHNREHETYSQIETLDPVSEKREVLFTRKGDNPFFQPHQGNVQWLGDSKILFSFASNDKKSALLYDFEREEVLQEFSTNPFLLKKEEFSYILKRKDYSRFLSKNQGF